MLKVGGSAGVSKGKEPRRLAGFVGDNPTNTDMCYHLE